MRERRGQEKESLSGRSNQDRERERSLSDRKRERGLSDRTIQREESQ